jgi:hypothetical protein
MAIEARLCDQNPDFLVSGRSGVLSGAGSAGFFRIHLNSSFFSG